MDRLLWSGRKVDKAAIEMLQKITVMGDESSASKDSNLRDQETNTNCLSRAVMVGTDLWTDGLICAFEFLGGNKMIGHSKSKSRIHPAVQVDGKYSKKQVLRHALVNASNVNTTKNNHLYSASHMDIDSIEIVPLNDKRDGDNSQSGHSLTEDRSEGSYWEPIGWSRISELVNAHGDAGWVEQSSEFAEAEDGLTVQDAAAPYWEKPVGPTWWCHVTAGHPFIDGWLSNAQWLHPAISIALRDESRLISERMKHLFYEDRSLRVTHNLTIFGGCGLVLSIITGLFGINVDGIPGADKTPYAFSIFTGILFFIGIVLIIIGKIYLGLKKPIKEDQVQVRTLELETLVKMFQHEAESHAQVQQESRKKELSPIVAKMLLDGA